MTKKKRQPEPNDPSTPESHVCPVEESERSIDAGSSADPQGQSTETAQLRSQLQIYTKEMCKFKQVGVRHKEKSKKNKGNDCSLTKLCL